MERKIDLRIQKTYISLHNAFTDLLEEKRFENITVNELCEKAMIRRTTFYKHFADKYEYYIFYIRETAASFQSEISSEILDLDINVYFMEMSSRLIYFFRENQKLIDNTLKSEMFPLLLNTLSEEIAQDFYQKARYMNTNMSSIELENYTAFYASGFLNMVLQYYKKHNALDEEAFFCISQYEMFQSEILKPSSE